MLYGALIFEPGKLPCDAFALLTDATCQQIPLFNNSCKPVKIRAGQRLGHLLPLAHDTCLAVVESPSISLTDLAIKQARSEQPDVGNGPADHPGRPQQTADCLWAAQALHHAPNVQHHTPRRTHPALHHALDAQHLAPPARTFYRPPATRVRGVQKAGARSFLF